MNFFKGILGKVVGSKPQLIEQEAFNFTILGTIFNKEEDKYTKLSSNTEFLFDKLQNDDYDHILIVRLHRASKQYNNNIGERQGDFYFNISYFQGYYSSTLDDKTEEFCISLIDIEKKQWNIRIQFSNSASSDKLKLKQFNLILCKLIYIWKYKKSISNDSNDLLKIIPHQQPSKLEVNQLISKKTQQKLRIVDKNILHQSIIRNKQEKEIIGDVLNYYLQQEIDTIKQLYAGKLYVLYQEKLEVRLINPMVILALNIISKNECRIELFNQERQLLLKQSLLEFVSFEVDKQHNYLSWIYFDGFNSVVLYLKFDIPDGATSLSLILQKERIKMKNYKDQEQDNLSDISQFSTSTTLQIPQQKQNNQYKLNPYQNNTNNIYKLRNDVNYKQILFLNKDTQILLEDRIVMFFENKKLITTVQITEDIKYNKAVLSQDQDHIALFQQYTQQLYIFDMRTLKIEQYNINSSIVDICQTENNSEYLILTPKQVFKVNKQIIKIYELENNVNDVFQVIRYQQEVIIGTHQGITLIFDGIQNMKLVNKFDGLGDTIWDIQLCKEFIIINNGYYISLQRIISDIGNGFKEQLQLKQFPIRVQLNPEDLILLGIFDIPKIEQMKVDDLGNIIIGSINGLQIVWNMQQILSGQMNSYQVFVLEQELFDQGFIGNDIVMMLKDELKERHQI